jgi:hypothetical protein
VLFIAQLSVVICFRHDNNTFHIATVHCSTELMTNSSTSRTAGNLTSSFYTGVILHGVYNKNHTSTAFIGYDPSTPLTPWPIVTGSIGLSFITACWALHTIRKSSDQSWVAGLGFTIVNTVRSVSTFIAACRAIAGDGGRWLAPSSVCAMVLANIPYTYRSPAPFDSVALINTLLSFAALGITGLAPWYRWNGLSYGKLGIFGGNCPVSNSGSFCPDLITFTTVGCGWADPKDKTYQFDGTTFLSLVEKIIGVLFFAPFAFCSAFIVPCLIVGVLAKAASGITEWLKSPDWEPANGDKHRKRQKVFLILNVVFILITGLATVSAHLNLELQQSSDPFVVIDSFGPVRNRSATPAGESWTDCFVVNEVHDRLGFLVLWWSTAKSRPEHILGLV